MQDKKFQYDTVIISHSETGVYFSDPTNSEYRKFANHLDCLSWLYANGKNKIADAYKIHKKPPADCEEKNSDLTGGWAVPKSIPVSSRIFSDYKKIIWHQEPWIKLQGEGDSLFKEDNLLILTPELCEKIETAYKEFEKTNPNFKPASRKKPWQ